MQCGEGEICDQGQCVACPIDTTPCERMFDTNVCADTMVDRENCGGCSSLVSAAPSTRHVLTLASVREGSPAAAAGVSVHQVRQHAATVPRPALICNSTSTTVGSAGTR